MLAFAENLAQNMKSGMPPVCTRTAPLTLTGSGVPIMANKKIRAEVFTVYRATCTASGKSYIGISVRWPRRWREHINAAGPRAKSLLSRAIALYGAAAFTTEILYEATSEREACAVERGLIAEYGTLVPLGYNLSTGGEGSVGRRVSAEGRRNLSEAVKRQWQNPEFRAKAIAAFQDRIIPESHKEHLRALAADMKGKPRDVESVEKGRLKLMGHTVSAETRAKMSASRTGNNKWWTEEKRAWRGEKSREAREAGAFDHLDYSAIAKARCARPEVIAKMKASWTEERKRAHAEKISAAAARRRELKEKLRDV
jgi:group I intron endonuclease